jgi:hypothetical protein
LPFESFSILPAKEQVIMEAVLQPIVTFYRESLERIEERYTHLMSAYEELLMERRNLQRAFERLEDYATEQEARYAALQDVLERFVFHSTRNVRRDLLDEFNAVAREQAIDFDEMNLLMQSDDEETVVDDASYTSLDDMFN